MQRIKLSSEKLNEVIQLRKEGNKWLQIQTLTKISRHIAKREYEDWEEMQSQGSLKEARKDVAAEAFRDHINYLVRIAEVLTEGLRLPTVNDSSINDDFLDKLWEIHSIFRRASSDSYANPESSEWQMPSVEPRIEINNQRNLRQNRMLFQSLIAHTRDKVNWKDLDEWKENWNLGINNIRSLRDKVLKMVDTFIAREESTYPSLKANIMKQHEYPLQQMAEAILTELLRRLENGETNIGREVTRTHQQSDVTQLIYSNSYRVILKFNNVNTAKAVSHVCSSVANELVNIHEKDLIIPVKTSIDLMKKIREKFEEVLDPLVLKPMIIKTVCKLCPAPL
jgi:uncharacterized protein YlxP (DUF503 family)